MLVAVDQKAPSGLSNVLEPREQILVEHFFAISAIEAFDVGVLVGFAGLDVLDGHAVLLRPLDEDLAQEPGPVVGAQHLRQRSLVENVLKNTQQPL